MSGVINENIVGEKIRQIRKERRVTLKDLADGICSLGKMSNIENGKAVPSEDELTAFASRLRVSVDNLRFLPFTTERKVIEGYDKWVKEAEGIEDFLQLDLIGDAKIKLDKWSVEVEDIPELELIKRFMWALYYNSINQIDSCIEILNEIVVEDVSEDSQMLLQIRAKTLLCALYIKSNNVQEACNLMAEIRSKVLGNMEVLGSEFWKFRFNMSVLLTIKGDYDLAKLYVGILSKEGLVEDRAEYLLAITDFVENNLASATERIYRVKKKLRQLGRKELLLKVMIAEYFVQLQFIANDDLGINSKNIKELVRLCVEVKDINKNLCVYCLNILLFLSLENNYEDDMEEIYEILSNLVTKDDNNIAFSLKSQAFLYMVKVAKKLKKEKSEVLAYIELGLKSEINKKSRIYANFLYEKANILEGGLPPIYESAILSFVDDENYKSAIKLNLAYLTPELII